MKIYDNVWVMDNNVPTSFILWRITERGKLVLKDKNSKDKRYICDNESTEIIYSLISPWDISEEYGHETSIAASWLTDYPEDKVFSSKEELVKSLF